MEGFPKRFGAHALLSGSALPLLVFALMPAAAIAQDEASVQSVPDAAATSEQAADAAPEIIVTARRRAERELDVPVALTALSNEELTRANADDLPKIANLVPGLIVARGASGNGGSLGIRGVSTAYSDSGVDSTVSISIDGAQLSRNYITTTAALDLAQVEVLKGPQALFFGKNSPAGVISLTSADPGSTFEAGVPAGTEFVANEYYTEAFAGGPVSDTFGVRGAVRLSTMRGYFINRAQPIANPFGDAAFAPTYPGAADVWTPSAENVAGRLTFVYQLDPTFEAKLKVFGALYRDNESTGYQQVVCCASCKATDAGVIDPFGDCKADKYRSAAAPQAQIAAGFPIIQDRGYGTRSKSILTTLALSKDLNWASLNAQSSYFGTRVETAGCYTYTAFCRFPGANVETNRIFEQEVRLLTSFDGPINAMVGGYFEDGRRMTVTHNAGVSAAAPRVRDPVTGRTTAGENNLPTDSRTLSAFGQLIWNVTPELELAAGARFTHDRKKGVYQNVFVNPAVPQAVAIMKPVGQLIFPRFSDNDLSPEATIRWNPTRYQTLYAAFKTGYKTGGFSAPGILQRTMTADFLEFGSESAKGGELGYKGELFDRRLRLNSNVYYYEFSGLQRSSLDVQTITFTVRNAASAVTKGAEAEATFQATDGLSLRVSGAYNDAYYKSYPDAACYKTTVPSCLSRNVGANVVRYQDLSGTPLSRAPKFVLIAGFDYETPVSDRLVFALNGTIRHSSSYLTQEDGNPAARQPSYQKFDAGISLEDRDAGWELSLQGRNRSNEYVVLYSANKPGGVAGDEIQGYVDRPREVALQFSYKF